MPSVESETIAHQWTLCFQNPVPPRHTYTYPYYLRASTDAWAELGALLRALGADQWVIVADQGLPEPLLRPVLAQLVALAPCQLLFLKGEKHARILPASLVWARRPWRAA